MEWWQFAFIFVICLLGFISSGFTAPSSSDGKNITNPNLWCHKCYFSVHGQECLGAEESGYEGIEIDRELCPIDHKYCMVEKLLTDGNLTTFTRSCSKECTEGCRSTGGLYNIEKCYNCCQDNFCNTGNNAENLRNSLTFITLIGVLGFGVSA